jgi:diguanylate cyclase (GGDEF)-like protein
MIVAILAVAAAAALGGPSSASQSTFRTYDSNQGLASLGGGCLLQDDVGYILVCTEHGVFAYDGRRFLNLGPQQGLREGGLVYGIALTANGRLAVGFADEVAISDRAADMSHPPRSLQFAPVQHPGISFFDERPHRFTAWRDGMVLLTGDTTARVVVPDHGPAHVDEMGYDRDEQRQLKGAVAVFQLHGQLWETFSDERICIADPGAVRCFGAADGLRGGPWHDLIAGPTGIMARSMGAVATLNAATGRWSVVDLPDQHGRYVNYVNQLGLFRAPDGGLMTQSDHGLLVLRAEGWRPLTVNDGAPAGTIMDAITDATGQLWFQVLGRGLVRWIGYGHWESLQRIDGLSDGEAWETVRAPGGPMWVSTDTGVDEVVRNGAGPLVSRVLPGSSFAIAIGPHGALWRSNAGHGVLVEAPATSANSAATTNADTPTAIDAPAVNAIAAGTDGTVWLGTVAGLYRVPDSAPLTAEDGHKPVAVLDGSSTSPVVDLLGDPAGGVYYLSGGRLRHRRGDGRDIGVSGPWPGPGFEPLALALGHDGSFWIGGAGGLYRFHVADDRVISYSAVETEYTRTNSIVAVMVDHRGWVWAGSALGVSVFNGQNWVSVDSDGGLLADDINQDGLREDPDGSVWIATTQGLSHLLDPAWLFADQPVRAVVSGAQLGSRPVVGARMAYTNQALSVEFGTPNDGAERSFVFRYQLSGVDAAWAESGSGLVRYPFVPPGRHVLTVVGYDELTHRSSPPATLVVDMEYPWWWQWWAVTLWVLSAAAFVYSFHRLRFRAILARQTELKRCVAEATQQLQFQAAHDSLTGLFNRSEIERQLAERLATGKVGEELIVALLDIDHFKRVNDEYGHLGGDDVLRAVGRMVSLVLRGDEYAGRYGGEEILMVLNDQDGSGADRVLELHHAFRGGSFNAAGHAIRLTCSIGLAWARRGDNWETLIGRADDALYKAKGAGRDRVVESGRINPPVRGIVNERRVRPGSV